MIRHAFNILASTRRFRWLIPVLVMAVLLMLPVLSPAQGTPLGTFAFDFNYSIQSQSPNTYTFQSATCNQPSGNGPTFFPFNTNAPVYVQDQNIANSERLTPSAVNRTASNCSITIAPANQHYTFTLRSGTAGLQEALNTLAVSSLVYPRVIFLDARWKAQITGMGLVPATVIGAVQGNTKAVLIDLTAYTNGRWTSYAWNNTAYVAQ